MAQSNLKNSLEPSLWRHGGIWMKSYIVSTKSSHKNCIAYLLYASQILHLIWILMNELKSIKVFRKIIIKLAHDIRFQQHRLGTQLYKKLTNHWPRYYCYSSCLKHLMELDQIISKIAANFVLYTEGSSALSVHSSVFAT